MNVTDQVDEEAECGRLPGTYCTSPYCICTCITLINTLDELVQLQDDILLLFSILHFRSILLLT